MAFPRRNITLDSGWHFRQVTSGTETYAWRPARPLPTEVYLDLLHNGAVSDITVGKNEDDLQWIGEQVWQYKTDLTIPRDVQAHKAIRKVLIFEGLDTYAVVKLDGRTILESCNMFLAHRVDITELVGSNTYQSPGKTHHDLEITFDNAEKRGDEEVKRHPEHQWTTFNSGIGRLATRKAQYHYGWDWGPKLMTCGPWRPIRLECYQSRIVDLSVLSSLSSDCQKATLNFALEVEGPAHFARLDISCGDNIIASISMRVMESTSSATLDISNPELWWPHTFGKQTMYRIVVKLYDSETSIADKPVDLLETKHGIRKIELIRQPLSKQEGTSFFFRVNNTPIFCAGSNWIPIDTSQSRITSDKCRRWVQLARDSNQVMLRIWGGGVYEHAALYDACDELGILIWHDFMFACGMFPAYDTFLESVQREAEENVRALRHHPCIALWCGNNEDYVIPLLSNIEYDAEEHDPKKLLASVFPARYTYEHLLPRICQRLAPDLPYWPGSPFGGSMINSTTEGDCHQWHVWHLEKRPYQDFPQLSARFVSEFGMQGMPCFETVCEFFPASDPPDESHRDWAEDEYIAFHNKCGGGLETLHEYCSSNIDFPNSMSLRRYIYSTQLIQSETTATAYRSWRRQWRGPGQEYCGGALIWQLNDCWPVTSWALADHHLRPKMAYWAFKRENQPITAGAQRTRSSGETSKNPSWDLWAVNTTLHPVAVTVRVRAWNVATGAIIGSFRICQTTLPANRSTELGKFESVALPFHSMQDFRDVVLAVELLDPASSRLHQREASRTEPSPVIARSVDFHEPLKHVPFVPQPERFEVDLIARNSDVLLRIRASHALKAVFVETDGVDEVRFDDNAFDVLPDESISVGVQGLRIGVAHRLRITWLGGGWRGEVGEDMGGEDLVGKTARLAKPSL